MGSNERPITLSEAAKILGCMNADIHKDIEAGEIKTIRPFDHRLLCPQSFREYCLRKYGVTLDRLPERDTAHIKRHEKIATRKSLKKLKRKKCSRKYQLK